MSSFSPLSHGFLRRDQIENLSNQLANPNLVGFCEEFDESRNRGAGMCDEFQIPLRSLHEIDELLQGSGVDLTFDDHRSFMPGDGTRRLRSLGGVGVGEPEVDKAAENEISQKSPKMEP